jgi:hypothetical protein
VRSIVLLLLLAGCASHSHVHIGAAGASGSVSVHTDVAGALALLVGTAVIANNLYGTHGETSSRYVPELDATRRVSEQDCSKPIDFTQGNIRCR